MTMGPWLVLMLHGRLRLSSIGLQLRIPFERGEGFLQLVEELEVLPSDAEVMDFRRVFPLFVLVDRVFHAFGVDDFVEHLHNLFLCPEAL